MMMKSLSLCSVLSASIVFTASAGFSGENELSTKCSAAMAFQRPVSDIIAKGGNMDAAPLDENKAGDAYMHCAKASSGGEHWAEEIDGANAYALAGALNGRGNVAVTTAYFASANRVLKKILAEKPPPEIAGKATFLIRQFKTNERLALGK